MNLTSVRNRVSPAVAAVLAQLGSDVSVARRRRRLTMDVAARGAGITRATWVRIERGDPAVSLAMLGKAMESLGLLALLGVVVLPQADRPALAQEVARLPARVRRRRGEL